MADTIDKSKWGDGPWQTEPDRVDWADEATGLLCSARRHPRMGHWCGYVCVPADHPLHGSLDCPDAITDVARVNFGNTTIDEDDESSGQWWLGFDCAHMYDLLPAVEAFERSYQPLGPRPTWKTYRTIEWVQSICADLAGAIASLAR